MTEFRSVDIITNGRKLFGENYFAIHHRLRRTEKQQNPFFVYFATFK